MNTHKLKCWPNYMDDLLSGNKTFEVRVNDRNYEVGDVLALQEFDPNAGRYRDRKLNLRVTYILHGTKSNPCISEKCCVMSVIKS
jgi:hypothetical protein